MIRRLACQNMRFFRLFICVILGCFSNGITLPALAGTCSGPSCVDVTIDRIFISNNGNIYVGTSGDENQLGGVNDCTPFQGQYLYLPASTTDPDKIMAMLLTAHERRAALAKITMRSYNTHPQCTINLVRYSK